MRSKPLHSEDGFLVEFPVSSQWTGVSVQVSLAAESVCCRSFLNNESGIWINWYPVNVAAFSPERTCCLPGLMLPAANSRGKADVLIDLWRLISSNERLLVLWLSACMHVSAHYWPSLQVLYPQFWPCCSISIHRFSNFNYNLS